jgi:hypothetical protein
MAKIIGMNIPPEKRREYWEAMQLFRAGSIELVKHKDTLHIGIADGKRYNRFLSSYVQ